MKIEILQENLSKGLNIVSHVISSKSQLPVLANILLTAETGKLRLTTTNLETGINFWLPAKVQSQGQITIPAKIINEFVSSLPADTVKLVKEQTSLKIACRNYKASFNGIPASEFPAVPSLKNNKLVKKISQIDLLANDFVKAIGQIAFTAATDESRPALSGVRISFVKKDIELVATDGYRLGIKTIKLKKGKKPLVLIIPAKALIELARIYLQEETEEEALKISLIKKSNQVIFSFAQTEIITRLIEGDFPDFEKILPKESQTKAIINKDDFQNAVRSAALFARDSANIVKIKIEKQKLKISANAPEVGKNEIQLNIKQTGEDNQTAFNFRFLQEYLSILAKEKEEVVLETSGPLKPGVFKLVQDSSFFHIIMPVRIQE